MNKIKQNMNKEQQDKLWNELSEESKKKIKAEYLNNIQEAHNPENSDEMVNVLLGKNEMLIDLFGYHNLNPKPTPKTWDDVEYYLEIIPDFKEIIHNLDVGCCDQKVVNKIIATYKISRIIELGYGGMMSEEEWKDDEIKKYVVKWCAPDKHSYNDWGTRHKYFIAFHTPEQREKFMSYESNRKLVEMYYLM